MSPGVLPSRDWIAFLLFDWLGDGKQRADKETALAIFDAAQELAADVFLPCYRKGDIEEPRLDDAGVHILPEIRFALRQFAELGLFGASFSEALGGMGLSAALTAAVVTANFGAANPAAAGYAMLTVANARLISTFGTLAQIEHFAAPQIAGRWFGTMCLSEPQAGSSLGDIRTKAHRDGVDELGERYRLVGNKMWISGGDQDESENIVHLVLAKVAREDGSLADGTRGISLFIVPKFRPDKSRNDVNVAGLNHKMGARGTSNCLLNFGERGGAVGWLVGKEGDGLAQMFTMMNEARINIGMSAAALAYRGYKESLHYAQERTQGRAPGTKVGPQIAINKHPDVRRMLLQQKTYAEGAISLCLYAAKLADEPGSDSSDLLALLTPVAKTWPSEFGLIANDLAIQVQGGYGYTRDFTVEQLWRDNRLNPIHEGTTGIQAIDLLRRKLLNSDGHALAVLRTRIEFTASAAANSTALKEIAASLLRYWDEIEGVIAELRTYDTHDALDDATLFQRAFGHGVVGWIWLDLALHSENHANTGLKQGIEYCCRFFYETEMPQARSWLSIVAAHSTLVRSMPEEALQ
jgi:alkylation response protein AidB-like acyl-CoA dehydrogenase